MNKQEIKKMYKKFQCLLAQKMSVNISVIYIFILKNHQHIDNFH